MNNAITLDNVGPIEHFEFSGSKPGITVFSGPNGVGKSIFQQAIQAAAAGSGKVPLRDNTRRGEVNAFGATITIGGNCRHTGTFEVLSLNGRFNLAELVDPRIDTPALADAARIKALVSLTGVQADVNLFRKNEAFSDTFATVVNPASASTDDLVDMAKKIKADYDRAALASEKTAERETSMASAHVPDKDLDLMEESDASVLQAAYNERRDELTRLEEQARNAASFKEQANRAKKILDDVGVTGLDEVRRQAVATIESSLEDIASKTEEINQLKLKIQRLQGEIQACQAAEHNAKQVIAHTDSQLKMVASAREMLSKPAITPPEQSDIDDAKEALALAQSAIEKGAIIRQAKLDAKKVQDHRKNAKLALQTAAKYRDAAKATDIVLSDSIKCKYLRVESDGKSSRLFTDTPERGKTLYHELSDGQKYKIAIDIGADQVGDGGLLTVDQIGWEGIDADNRIAIHAHAIQRGVHIWVLEASREVGAPRQIVAKPFDPDSLPKAPEPVPAPVAAPQAAKKAETPLPAAKKVNKSAAKPAPKSPPVADPLSDDEDEIPF